MSWSFLTNAINFFFYRNQQGEFAAARWDVLKDLWKTEAETFMSTSHLTKASLSPSNIEKQKVSLVLNVFCDQTISALRTSTAMKTNEDASSTAEFLRLVVNLWKALNNKNKFAASRFNDPARCVIDYEDSQGGLALLQHWADFNILSKPPRGMRIKSLTMDTASALSWTCSSLRDLAKFLLTTSLPFKHDYVLLGFFQQDDLEKHFGHFRMSAGCNYFISVKDVMAIHNMDRAKLLVDSIEGDTILKSLTVCNCSESCTKNTLSSCEQDLIMDMPAMLPSISPDDKMGLFYVAGFLAFKNPDLAGSRDYSADDVCRHFLDDMNRGKLSYPREELFQMVLYGFLFFTHTKETLCRTRFVQILEGFPSHFSIDIFLKKDTLRRLANILFKKFCLNTADLIVAQKKNKKSDKVTKAQRTTAKLSSASVKS